MGIIFNKAMQAAQDGVLTSREVGQLISDTLQNGEITHAERKDLQKIQAELEAQITPDAREALRSFLSLGPSFDGNIAGDIFGLEGAKADRLEKAGVSSVADLLIASKMPEDREALSIEARIDLVELTSFVEQADLARVSGIGRSNAAVLHGVGINNVRELAEQDPAELRGKIVDFLATDEGQNIARRRPSTTTLTKWIDNAKTLPQLIRYVDDDGASFTKEAFNELRDYQKASLLWGSDVTLADGSVFENEDLSVDTPARKPRAVSDTISSLENSGIEDNFEFAELANIERVKLDDETLGYRLEFDVKSTGINSEMVDVSDIGVADAESAALDPDIDHELMSMGDFEGTAYVALDANGRVLNYDFDIQLAPGQW